MKKWEMFGKKGQLIDDKVNEGREITDIKKAHVELVEKLLDKDDNVISITTMEDENGPFFGITVHDAQKAGNLPLEFDGFKVKVTEGSTGGRTMGIESSQDEDGMRVLQSYENFRNKSSL